MKKAVLWGGLVLLLLAVGVFAMRLLDRTSPASGTELAQESADVTPPASDATSASTGTDAATSAAAGTTADADDGGTDSDSASATDADTAAADATAQAAIAQAEAKAKAATDALAASQKAAADKAAADKAIADAKAVADAKAAADAKALADARAAEEQRRKEREAIGGRWTGVYRYAAGTPAPVRFTIDLIGDTGVFSGRMSEPNTFGDASAAFLFANITGRVSGNRVTFTKTYDGTGGQSHSVPYEGTLDKGTMTVRGNWRIDQTGGSFEMKKGS